MIDKSSTSAVILSCTFLSPINHSSPNGASRAVGSSLLSSKEETFTRETERLGLQPPVSREETSVCSESKSPVLSGKSELSSSPWNLGTNQPRVHSRFHDTLHRSSSSPKAKAETVVAEDNNGLQTSTDRSRNLTYFWLLLILISTKRASN